MYVNETGIALRGPSIGEYGLGLPSAADLPDAIRPGVTATDVLKRAVPLLLLIAAAYLLWKYAGPGKRRRNRTRKNRRR